MTLYHYTYLIGHNDCGYFYIGKRSSKQPPERDSYMGSGKELKRLMSLDPTGWTKHILSVHPTAQEAYAHEKQLVTSETAKHPACLNIAGGGSGWNGQHKRSPEAVERSAAGHRGKLMRTEVYDRMRSTRTGVFTPKPKSPEWRASLSASRTGVPNPKRRAFTDEQLDEIRQLFASGISRTELIARFGHGQTLYRVLRRG